MKRLIIIFAAILFIMPIWSQSPDKMSYQAIVRNNNAQLITGTQVSMQISILQSSASGTPVYVETHMPTTNSSGLVSLEIGSGTAVSGNFSSIDWAAGPYFIKTETDPTGGNNYSITGINQLLSVPYALNAKSADSIVGGISETDPVYGSSVAADITGTDTSNWNNKQELLTAGKGIEIKDHMINATTYKVGDFAHGGIVFWTDKTGQHGLVCAKEDLNEGSEIRWHAGTNGHTQAKGDGPLAGKANTSIIIAAHAGIGDDGDPYAARICNELIVTEGEKNYGDWYLPSKEELTLIYDNKTSIDSTAIANDGGALADDSTSDIYWSSTESDDGFAWVLYMYDGLRAKHGKAITYRVRAVRTF